MEKTFESLVSEFGKFSKNGADYTLTQDAYPETNAGSNVIAGIIAQGQNYYTADGYDRAGNPVKLVWSIVNPDADDASDACDWDDFAVVSTVGDPAPWK